MNSYSQMTWKYLKNNKKRTTLTIIGIVLAVCLFSAIGTFFYSFKENIIEMEKIRSGNYEVCYSNVNKSIVNKIENNFKVKNYGVSIDPYKINYNYENRNFSVQLDNYDSNMFKNIENINLVNGNIPKEKGEIILDKRLKNKLNKKLGDKIAFNINNIDKIFKIVGFFDSTLEVSGEYSGITLINEKDLYSDNYNIYVNLKDNKKVRETAKEISGNLALKDNQIKFNENLLRAMIQGGDENINNSLKHMIAIVLPIIILCTVAVIYNSFNISVAERTKHFGILRSIGASPFKIKRLVFQEAFIMCAISIPLGIILGYLGLYVIVENFIKTNKLLMINNDLIFNIRFYPKVILTSSLLAIITVFLSVVFPARKAAKVSPIEAIRNSTGYKNQRLKRRKGRLVKLFFGIEGEIAYKNIRRNNKRFIITIISLCISFIMFVTFTAVMKAQKSIVDQAYDEMLFDASIISKEDKLNNNIIKEVSNNDNIEKIFTPIDIKNTLFIEKSKINKEYLNKEAKDTIEDINIDGKDYIEFNYGDINGYDNNSIQLLNKYCKNNIDENQLKNGGVILKDINAFRKNGKYSIGRFTNYKVGDTINIPKIPKDLAVDLYNGKITKENFNNICKEAIKNGDFIKSKIIAIIDKNPIDDNKYPNRLSLIFSKQYFEENLSTAKQRSIAMIFKSGANINNEQFETLAEDNNSIYMNTEDMKNLSSSFNSIISIFIYGFIIIVCVISIVNIINTITMGLLLRKSEFATLSAIGMTKGQLSKMVILEGVLYGVIVSIIGSIISFGLFIIIMRNPIIVTENGYRMPIEVFIVGIVSILLLSLLASLIPLSKFKKMSIVQNIRAEE